MFRGWHISACDNGDTTRLEGCIVWQTNSPILQMYWHFSFHTAVPLFSQRSENFHSNKYFSGLLFSCFLKKHAENWSYLSYFLVWHRIVMEVWTTNSEQHACHQGDKGCLQLDKSYGTFQTALEGWYLQNLILFVYFQYPDLCFILLNNQSWSLPSGL